MLSILDVLIDAKAIFHHIFAPLCFSLTYISMHNLIMCININRKIMIVIRY